jgi:hypothetical protein
MRQRIAQPKYGIMRSREAQDEWPLAVISTSGIVVGVRNFFCFYWQCVKHAARGCTPAANDWQWLIGFPLLAVILWLVRLRYGEGVQLFSQDSALGVLIAAAAAFVLTWVATFLVKFTRAPVNLYQEEKTRADALAAKMQPRIRIRYDQSIQQCNDVVTFTDSSRSICFRLQIENIGITAIRNCEGWLTRVLQMPGISPVKLFWIGMPAERMTEDLPQRVPRYLQICRVTDTNRVVMATEREFWPLGETNIFRPREYVFHITVNAEGIEAVEYQIRLDWTGNWKTATMNPYQQA